jgi:hypothetical protein
LYARSSLAPSIFCPACAELIKSFISAANDIR